MSWLITLMLIVIGLLFVSRIRAEGRLIEQGLELARLKGEMPGDETP